MIRHTRERSECLDLLKGSIGASDNSGKDGRLEHGDIGGWFDG